MVKGILRRCFHKCLQHTSSFLPILVATITRPRSSFLFTVEFDLTCRRRRRIWITCIGSPCQSQYLTSLGRPLFAVIHLKLQEKSLTLDTPSASTLELRKGSSSPALIWIIFRFISLGRSASFRRVFLPDELMIS